MTATLTATRVEEIVRDCLFTDEELPGDVSIDNLPDGAVVTDGIINPMAFHGGRLAEHRDEIIAMLNDLPTEFLDVAAGGGGGWSFLNACMTRDGEQWTGFHRTQDMLVQLGIGVGAAKWLLPRELWTAMPGGMPYFVVTETPS